VKAFFVELAQLTMVGSSFSEGMDEVPAKRVNVVLQVVLGLPIALVGACCACCCLGWFFGGFKKRKGSIKPDTNVAPKDGGHVRMP